MVTNFKQMKTIKTTSTILIFMLSISIGNAQNIRYGFTVGGAFSTQSALGDIYDNDDVRTTLQIGGFANYKLQNKLSLQTEVLFEQKGSKTDDYTNKFDYVTVPFFASYTLDIGKTTPWNLDFYLGPYASFLTKAEQEFENSELETVDLSSNTEDLDYGLMYGLNYRYPIKQNNIMVGLRYIMGLNSFDKTNADLRNKTLSLSIGYEF